MDNFIITVNEKEISVDVDGTEKYVAVKPICEAIGVDFQTQLTKIKEDEILSQLYRLRPIVAADEKQRNMGAIPLRYVFGWLFTINPNNVKPEIKNDVIKYKKQCYDALFDTFTKRTSILKEKSQYQIEIQRLESELEKDERFKKIKELKLQMKGATRRLNSLDKNIVQEELELFKKEEQ